MSTLIDDLFNEVRDGWGRDNLVTVLDKVRMGYLNGAIDASAYAATIRASLCLIATKIQTAPVLSQYQRIAHRLVREFGYDCDPAVMMPALAQLCRTGGERDGGFDLFLPDLAAYSEHKPYLEELSPLGFRAFVTYVGKCLSNHKCDQRFVQWLLDHIYRAEGRIVPTCNLLYVMAAAYEPPRLVDDSAGETGADSHNG